MKLDLEMPQEALDKIGVVMRTMALDAFSRASEGAVFGEYMTRKDAAKFLHVSPQTLNEFINKGLRVTTIGNVQRISQASCRQFMKNNEI